MKNSNMRVNKLNTDRNFVFKIIFTVYKVVVTRFIFKENIIVLYEIKQILCLKKLELLNFSQMPFKNMV